MTKIDRYALKFNGGRPEFLPEDGGPWVRYEDHLDCVHKLEDRAGFLTHEIERADPTIRSLLQSAHLAAQIVNEPNLLCATCQHPAKNHTLGRCRKKRCGCGGWRG